MRLNLNLTQKSLILVGFLLVLELVFVGAQGILLNRAEQDALQEAHSKEIVGTTNRIFQLVYDAGQAAADYQMRNGGSVAAKRYHDSAEKIQPEMTTLKALVKDNPQFLEIVERIDKDCTKAVRIVSFIMNLSETGRTMEAAAVGAKVAPTFKKLQSTLFDEIREFMKAQQKIIDEGPAAQARSRQTFKWLLMVGVGLNIVIAIGLALWLVKGVTTRLDLVVDNTTRLTKHEKLNEPLSGSDEIASLDHAFHDMARKLKEVEEMKQQFLAMVSHDLRSPLTSAHNLLETLVSGVYGELSETASRRVAAAEKDMTRLLKMINDLLDIERLSAGGLTLDCQPLYLSDVIRTSMDAIRSFADSAEVSLRTKATDLEVVADGDRLVQVLVNLISNAIKFSPQGGAVTTFAEEDGDYVVVKIVDQGRGVPPSMYGTIFERFKQVEKADATKKKGTGLGLPICKALVEQHHGTIGVTSEEGKGSTFWFRIPKQPPGYVPKSKGQIG